MGVKPSKYSQSLHSASLMTDAHARRMASGRMESRKGDYQVIATKDAIKARDARRALEDLKIAREQEEWL